MDDPTWRLYSQLSSQPPDLRVISGVYDTNEIKLKKKRARVNAFIKASTESATRLWKIKKKSGENFYFYD